MFKATFPMEPWVKKMVPSPEDPPVSPSWLPSFGIVVLEEEEEEESSGVVSTVIGGVGLGLGVVCTVARVKA